MAADSCLMRARSSATVYSADEIMLSVRAAGGVYLAGSDTLDEGWGTESAQPRIVNGVVHTLEVVVWHACSLS